ncbi:hypothetical protein OHD05_04995 [Escherichia coli]|uniref:hypothetical protein n=1 Tax=Escherichia coli TaxID=562 RepID=UPI002237B947|nr:hypothetical protein [Escherichia coli]MCW7306515.1 hypothetical protein [Escherichia coli]
MINFENLIFNLAISLRPDIRISTLVSVFGSCFFSVFSVNVILHFVPLVYVPGLKSSGRMRPDVLLFRK